MHFFYYEMLFKHQNDEKDVGKTVKSRFDLNQKNVALLWLNPERDNIPSQNQHKWK